MTDQEKQRLQEIEGRFYSDEEYFEAGEDVGYLLEVVSNLQKQLRASLERERVLAEGLEFYANENHWMSAWAEIDEQEQGKRARSTIETVNKMRGES